MEALCAVEPLQHQQQCIMFTSKRVKHNSGNLTKTISVCELATDHIQTFDRMFLTFKVVLVKNLDLNRPRLYNVEKRKNQRQLKPLLIEILLKLEADEFIQSACIKYFNPFFNSSDLIFCQPLVTLYKHK